LKRDLPESGNLTVTVAPRSPSPPEDRSAWRAFVATVKDLFDWGKGRGARAAEAAVMKLEAEAAQISATAHNLDADTEAKRIHNTKQTIELMDQIFRADEPVSLKLAKLELLRSANPELVAAVERVRASLELLEKRGASVKVVEDNLIEDPDTSEAKKT
jgi:hypothetical protein